MPAARWSTRLSRSSTVPVSASTKLMNAAGSAIPSWSVWSDLSSVASQTRRTPSVGVGIAISRARWRSREVAEVNVVHGPSASTEVSCPRSRSTSLAAACRAAAASSSRDPETVSSPVTEDETYPMRPSRWTPTVSRPSWAASRSPKVCRKVTTWATSALRTCLAVTFADQVGRVEQRAVVDDLEGGDTVGGEPEQVAVVGDEASGHLCRLSPAGAGEVAVGVEQHPRRAELVPPGGVGPEGLGGGPLGGGRLDDTLPEVLGVVVAALALEGERPLRPGRGPPPADRRRGREWLRREGRVPERRWRLLCVPEMWSA